MSALTTRSAIIVLLGIVTIALLVSMGIMVFFLVTGFGSGGDPSGQTVPPAGPQATIASVRQQMQPTVTPLPARQIVSATGASGQSLPLTSISAGRGHTCGLNIQGSVVCWGYNDGGQASPALLVHSSPSPLGQDIPVEWPSAVR